MPRGCSVWTGEGRGELMLESALYRGEVTHRRLGAPAHAFRYPLYMLLLDLDELPTLGQRLRLFGYEVARPVSVWERDLLDREVGSVYRRLRLLVERRGAVWPGGAVRLLTHARVFGYVFNPVSFYFCHDPAGALALIVADVNNTFGERHAYVLDDRCEIRGGAGDASPHADVQSPESIGTRSPAADAGPRRWQTRKVFHVSPFMSLDGTYAFAITAPRPGAANGEAIDVRIALTVAGATRFAARLSLTRRSLTDAALAGALVRYPLMTAQVIGAIHWQALRLSWKGAAWRGKPPYDPAAAERETQA
jgi:DUF1365 family protein